MIESITVITLLLTVLYVEHWKLFLEYLMTPRVLKVLCNFHLDSVFIWDRTDWTYKQIDDLIARAHRGDK